MKYHKIIGILCSVTAVVALLYIYYPKIVALISSPKTTATSLSVKIGDYKEILKLSVLDVDIEDAYPVDIENKKVVYKIPAHCEFKYNLEKIRIEETDTTIVLKLPPCEPEVTTQSGTPTILYEEEGTFSAFMDNNVTVAQDKKALKDLADKIKNRVKREYQDIAFYHAKSLLESFYSNTGKDVIVLEGK